MSVLFVISNRLMYYIIILMYNITKDDYFSIFLGTDYNHH